MSDLFEQARAVAPRVVDHAVKSLSKATRSGDEWSGVCPFHDDGTPSFRMNATTGQFYCHGCGTKGDLIGFYQRIDGLTPAEAAALVVKLGGNGHASIAPAPRQKIESRPATDNEVQELHNRLSREPGFHSLAPYRDADGRTLFCVARHEPKKIRPWYITPAGEWKQGQPLENGRPLLWLPALLAAPEAAVVIVEGEKDAAAARAHIKALNRADVVVSTWSGGASAWRRTDFSPLHGRRVYLAPDADEPGRKAAEGIAELLRSHSDIYMVGPRDGAKPGEGAADLDAATFGAMIDAARSLKALDALPMLEADAIVSRIWPEVVPRIIPDMLAQCTTEDGFSEVVTTVINGSIVYAPAFDEFFIKQHHEYYEPDTAGIVWHVIRLIARRLGDFRGLYTGDPRAIDQILKRMKTKTGLDAVYAMIKKSPSLIRMENELDPHGLIMTPDGAFDPLTCSRVARPGAVFTKQTNYSPDFNREPVEFLRFMESLFDDTGVVYRLLDLMAVAVAGQAPAIEKGPILAGSEAGSGKNQLAELTEAVFGAYFAWVRPEWLYENKAAAGDVPTSNIIRLIGKLFMVCSEPTDHPLNSSLYKTLVSGEALPSRKQHSTKFIDVTTRGLLLILANRKPYFHHDKGTRRRIENYEFSKSFYDSPDRVEDIGRKIARAEGPAILGHLMTRARDWHLRGGGLGGLYYSQAVEQWTNDFLGWGDSIGRFIGDELERTSDGRESVSDVWQRFKRWAESNGESIISVRALGEALSERGIKRKRRNTGMYFEGVSLK